MSKRYSGKSFKDSSVNKKPKLSLKEKRKQKKEKTKKILRFSSFFTVFFKTKVFWSTISTLKFFLSLKTIFSFL